MFVRLCVRFHMLRVCPTTFVNVSTNSPPKKPKKIEKSSMSEDRRQKRKVMEKSDWGETIQASKAW